MKPAILIEIENAEVDLTVVQRRFSLPEGVVLSPAQLEAVWMELWRVYEMLPKLRAEGVTSICMGDVVWEAYKALTSHFETDDAVNVLLGFDPCSMFSEQYADVNRRRRLLANTRRQYRTFYDRTPPDWLWRLERGGVSEHSGLLGGERKPVASGLKPEDVLGYD